MDQPLSALIANVHTRAARAGRRVDLCQPDAIEIDHFRVLFAALPRAPRDAPRCLDAQLDRALRVWTNAGQSAAVYLYLFFAGPIASSTDPSWQRAAAEIERDERVCRKLVWLPDAECGNLDAFIRRTFLASPWTEAEQPGAGELAWLGDELGVPEAWLEHLMNPSLEGRSLVEALLPPTGRP